MSLNQGVVLYLPLWSVSLQGTPIISKDNYQHSCAVTGATWGSTGRTFDGIDDNIALPDSAVLDVTSVNASVRVKLLALKGAAAYGTIMGQTTSYAYYIYTTEAYINANINQGGNVDKTITAAAEINNWHLVGFSYTSGSYYTYYDAVQSAVTATTGNLIADSTIRVGGSAGRFTNAVIGEAFVYNRVLSQAEITQIYNLTLLNYQGGTSRFGIIGDTRWDFFTWA